MLENLSGQDLKNQFKTNQKARVITYSVAAVIVIVLGYFAYNQFIYKPANEKSKYAYVPGLNYANMDSIDKAIEVLAPVAKKYNGKDGGEMAQYLLGVQYMKKGEFKKAIDQLSDVKFDDSFLSVAVISLQGDCQSELKNYEKALSLYIRASKKNTNEKTTPENLFKAGLVCEKLNDFEQATKLYKEIKNEYIEFGDSKAIDKYIARVENKKKK